VDGYCGHSAEAAVQYGRILFEPFFRDGKARILTVGEREFVQQPGPADTRGRFNRLIVRVSPDKVSYLCNGVVVFEDQAPAPTTPWLALLGRCTRTTAWCNLRLTGNPEIPPEVRLIQDSRMEGWMSPLYQERLPRQFQSVAPGQIAAAAPSPTSSRGCAWFASDGVLFAPRLKSPTSSLDIQSWLAYHRPLRSGETISYDFFYQPDEKMVYPTLGRFALIVETGSVHLHWITDIPHLSIGGLRNDNVVAIEQQRNLRRRSPLKPDQWNTMTIHMGDDRATFHLNGTELYEYRLGPTDNRIFGLFRYRNRTAAEVRHIVIRGNWPRHLSTEQLSQPVARADVNESGKDRQTRQLLVDESWLELRAQSR
jgi:hypothetical protein